MLAIGLIRARALARAAAQAPSAGLNFGRAGSARICSGQGPGVFRAGERGWEVALPWPVSVIFSLIFAGMEQEWNRNSAYHATTFQDDL